jgi:hypothetical protein
VLQILEVEVMSDPSGEVRLQFPAVAGRTYTLQVRTTFPGGHWEDRISLPATTETGVVTLFDADPGNPTYRLYRIVTP